MLRLLHCCVVIVHFVVNAVFRTAVVIRLNKLKHAARQQTFVSMRQDLHRTMYSVVRVGVASKQSCWQRIFT